MSPVGVVRDFLRAGSTPRFQPSILYGSPLSPTFSTMRIDFLTWKLALLAPALVLLGNCKGGASNATPAPQGGGSGAQVQFETLHRVLPDGIVMSADLYRAPAVAGDEASARKPVLVCMHMTASSRGEYRRIAPSLLERGFNVLAVDLRCGGEGENSDRRTGARWGVMNDTWNMARTVLGHTPSYFEAYPDVAAAVDWAHELFPVSRVGLMGSSYSASLALAYAAEFPGHVEFVGAFSPGEYMPPWVIRERAATITVPTYVTCGNTAVEMNHAKPIANGILSQSLVSKFWPEDEGWVGDHGSKTLLIHHLPSRAKQWERFDAALAPLKVPVAAR